MILAFGTVWCADFKYFNFRSSMVDYEQHKVTFIEVMHVDDHVTFDQFFEAMIHSDLFAARFRQLLSMHSEGLFFETPALNANNVLTRKCQFVLIPSGSFSNLTPDARAFKQKFGFCKHDVVRFSNINGDAELVAPCPSMEHKIYTHLANFCKFASKEQFNHLWRTTIKAFREHLARSGHTVWLSTHGLGISWLHLRIDLHPKYYHYEPFTRLQNETI